MGPGTPQSVWEAGNFTLCPCVLHLGGGFTCDPHSPFPTPAVQRGSRGHPGRCAGPRRRQPAPAQVPRELPEPLHGPGAAAEGEHQPEGDGQGGPPVVGPQLP